MNRLLNELSAVFTALAQSITRRLPRTFVFGLLLMVSLGLFGNTLAHAGILEHPVAVTASQQVLLTLSPAAPLPEEDPIPRNLPFSFMEKALDLEIEAEGLLDLTPTYATILLSENESALKTQVRRPLAESHSFVERHHAPIFIFLQIFRL